MRRAALALQCVVMAACGSGNEDGLAGGFGTCEVSGTPFGHQGTAVIRGTGLLPSLRDDLSIQLLLEAPPGFKVGVLPQNLFEFQRTCGEDFPFEVTNVDVGTYTVWVEVRDPELADATNDEDLVYSSDANPQVTVADGQVLEMDLDFRM